MAGAEQLVHHDAVIHGEPCLLSQLERRNDPKARHRRVGQEFLPAGGAHRDTRAAVHHCGDALA